MEEEDGGIFIYRKRTLDQLGGELLLIESANSYESNSVKEATMPALFLEIRGFNLRPMLHLKLEACNICQLLFPSAIRLHNIKQVD